MTFIHMLVLILFSPTLLLAYPTIYGTKRYGYLDLQRINNRQQPISNAIIHQRYPSTNYYDFYPDDIYYSQDYPVYYPSSKTSKYDIYQTILPYYYGNNPIIPKNKFYDNDNVLQQQEIDREEREEREELEDSQPIEHNMLYENNNQDNLDDINAAFLQNLILSQIYKDQLHNEDDIDDNNKITDDNYLQLKSKQEDEDVKELQQLAKPIKMIDNHWFANEKYRNQKKSDNNPIKSSTTTTVPTTVEPKNGQKEVVMGRPATPNKNIFSLPLLEMLSSKTDKRRSSTSSSSIYNTLRNILESEKNSDYQYDTNLRPQMKKRIITNEDNLTQQLSVLKRAQ